MDSNAIDNDDDLQRAIAMSLEEAVASKSNGTGLSTNPQVGIERLLSTKTAINKIKRLSQTHENGTSSETKVPDALGFLGLDRKAMERERLARAAARKREKSISPPPSKRVKSQRQLPTTTIGKGTSLTTRDPAPEQSADATPIGVRYPRGAIKKTWSPDHQADDRTIKIEDVIDQNSVRVAVLSTFMIDPDWVFKKFDVSKTKFYMILHGKSTEERTMLRQDFEGVQQARLCLPRLTGAIGCQHSKLMLLFCATYLRVVLPTANLVDFDWGETGLMENTVFLIDLPRRAEAAFQPDLPPFGCSLLEFLKHQDVPKDVREGLFKFDFSATQGMAFIHTSEGAHLGDNASTTGLPSLSAAVRQLDLAADDVQVDFAASSIGSLTDEFVNTIYAAAQGKDITQNREKRKQLDPKVRANTRIYFPTEATVKSSIGGQDNAGTICMQRGFWDKPGFPRGIFNDYRSRRVGLLSHNKLLFVRGKRDGRSIAWIYIGSANCSGSAWGNLVTKGVKLNCNNWESGVVVAVDDPPDDLSDLGQVFASVVDVPFECGQSKGLEYGDSRPWFYMRKDRL